MARHSSPRRLARRRQRMQSWAARDARKMQAGQELARRESPQGWSLPVSPADRGSRDRADRRTSTERQA